MRPGPGTKRGIVGLVRDTVVYAAGLVLRRGLGVITLPVLTRYLSTHEFGLLAIVGTVRDLLTVAFELGTPNAAARFFYDCRSEAERRRLFGSLWIVLMAAALVGSLLLVVVGPSAWDRLVADVPFHPYVSLTVATVGLSAMGVLPRSLFRVTDRVPLFMTLSVLQGLATSALVIALVVAGFGALGPVLGGLGVSAVFFSSSSGTSGHTWPGNSHRGWCCGA